MFIGALHCENMTRFWQVELSRNRKDFAKPIVIDVLRTWANRIVYRRRKGLLEIGIIAELSCQGEMSGFFVFYCIAEAYVGSEKHRYRKRDDGMVGVSVRGTVYNVVPGNEFFIRKDHLVEDKKELCIPERWPTSVLVDKLNRESSFKWSEDFLEIQQNVIQEWIRDYLIQEHEKPKKAPSMKKPKKSPVCDK